MLTKVLRLPYSRTTKFTLWTRIQTRFCSDENKKSDGSEKPATEDKETKKKQASQRLNDLLAQMPTESVLTPTSITLPKPSKAARIQKRAKHEAKQEESSSSSDSSSDSSDDEKPKNIVEAAKKVATSMGGDSEKTEAELLSRLLGSSSEQKVVLSDLLAGMKVESQPKARPERTRADFVRDAMPRQQKGDSSEQKRQPFQRRVPRSDGPVARVDLFGAEPLGIFTKPVTGEQKDICQVWQELEERELKLAVQRPPANYYEKMIQWTEQGKLWKFPIDNFQDIGPEAEVDFSEHIFLEDLLEPWCPARGPVRHFMELVTVGLSKNPYMSVAEKHEHINYYRDYFESKKELLKQIVVETKETQQKQVS